MRKITLFLIGFLIILPCLIYCPADEAVAAPLAWQYLSPMNTARFNHTATLLSDGRMLVSGGTQGGDTYLNSAIIYDPFDGRWFTAAAMNYARMGHTATPLANGKVLVTGGKGVADLGIATYLNNAEIYDPLTDNWTMVPDTMQTPRQFHTASLLEDGRVLLVGGQTDQFNMTASSEMYNPVNNSFTSVEDLPNTARLDHTATRLPNGTILIAGGQTGLTNPTTYTNTTALFNPLTNTFSAGPSFSGSRGRHSAVLSNTGKVLVVGGRYNIISTITYRDDLQIYDPETNSWDSGAVMPTARSEHAASLLPNGMLLISGGYNGNAVSDCQLYDPDENTWSAANGLNQTRYRHTVLLLPSGSIVAAGGTDGSNPLVSLERFDPPNGFKSPAASLHYLSTPNTATVLPNGKVLITGIRIGTQNTNYTEIYDPVANIWSAHTPMGYIRRDHTATLLPDGRVLVVGGTTETNGAVTISEVEIYDPNTQTWTEVSPMNDARRKHTATLLADGRVLVVSGANNDTSIPGVSSAEIYNPDNNTWTVTAGPAQPRTDHKAVLLSDGRVMIAGGMYRKDTGNFSTLNSVEIFDPKTKTWTEGAPMSNEVNPSYGKVYFTLNLLPDGRVLSTGGNSGILYYAGIERYDPTTDTWSSLGLLPTKRANHTVTVMGDGKLLITGGSYETWDGPVSIKNWVNEYLIFDPATASLTLSNSMVHVRAGHKAALLPNGRILIIAGNTISSENLGTSELYTSGIGFAQSWRPEINQISDLQLGEQLILAGEQFFGYGLTEAAGSGTQSASSGHPLLLLYSLGNEQVKWISPDPDFGFAPNSFTSIPVTNFPAGPTYAIIYTNGIASEPYYLSLESKSYSVFLPLLIR